MRLNENYRRFPIKFYQNGNEIYFENKILVGHAKTLQDAFKFFSDNDWERDFVYYYDDIVGVEFGSYEPSLTNKEYKGMLYLGQLHLRVDVDPSWNRSEHSVTYIIAHPEYREEQMKFIEKMKKEEKLDKLKAQWKDRLKSGMKKVAGLFEMFTPYKTREDLICAHCGEIIPTGTYYEEWKKKPYHLECIWDSLTNNRKKATRDEAREYFFSLQDLLDKWPGDLDCPDDYISDLELVKSNDRRIMSKEQSII